MLISPCWQWVWRSGWTLSIVWKESQEHSQMEWTCGAPYLPRARRPHYLLKSVGGTQKNLSSLVFPAQNFFLWPSLLHYPVHWDSLCSSSKVQFVAHLFRGRQNERLSSVLLQHGLFPSSQCSLHPTVAIEIFMSSSYSRWWAPCGCMLQLIHFCIHGPNPSDTQ